jgi:hypothetical protein
VVHRPLRQRHLQNCVARGDFRHMEHIVAIAAQSGDDQRVAAFVGEEIHQVLPDARTISSPARCSAAKAAAARMSSGVRWG